ncbi:MAG TPA: hypothetical protein VGG79_12935 [Roseiarcus sp.]|jgi:hypothetical protein
MKKRVLLAASAAFAMVAAAPGAHAIVLSPGASGSPDLLSLGVGSTLVADTGSVSFSNSAFSGAIDEWVYQDTANTFGSGDLTWVIQVANTSSSNDAIGRVTAGNFAGFMTDVGDNGGADAPDLVDRDTPGHTIGFSWAETGGLLVGDTSALLFINTNATRFVPGTLAVIDSQTSDLSGFQPSAVPESATWAMMLIGFAGLGVAGYRGSRKSAPFAA